MPEEAEQQIRRALEQLNDAQILLCLPPGRSGHDRSSVLPIVRGETPAPRISERFWPVCMFSHSCSGLPS
jgi:hypothetical protein